jgi:arabinose-5-phosphate isomerase
MALGDALAIALMKKRGFKREDFASFHPGGSLGKQLFVKLHDIMRKSNLPIVDEDISLRVAIAKMSEGRLGTLLFTKNGKLSAILSDGDLRRAMLEDSFSLENQAIIYANKVPQYIDNPSILASDALKLIEDNKMQLLIITDSNKRIQGVIHIHDLIEMGIKGS